LDVGFRPGFRLGLIIDGVASLELIYLSKTYFCGAGVLLIVIFNKLFERGYLYVTFTAVHAGD